MKHDSSVRYLIGPFTQLLTMDRLPIKGSIQDQELEIIEHAGMIIQDGKIEKVGKFNEFHTDPNVTVQFIEGDNVCLPGFIDAHTHICFAGSRANDYAARNAGKSYLEIAEEGGGIWSTVQHTRSASKSSLVKGIVDRAELLLGNGITTIEVKSGYGLSVEEEIKMLEAINEANLISRASLIPTCLAAHTKPKDFIGTEREYLEKLIHELLPEIKRRELSKRIDIFIEKGSFNVEDGLFYLREAKKLGFELTVHADQFSPGGSKVAVEVGAMSADHLEASKDEEIDLIAKSDTVAVALPGATLGLGCGFTPARKLLDKGASLAIASDWNPGSAPMGDLLVQASVLGTFEKLTNAEVLTGITCRAALSLNQIDIGLLKPKYNADFITFPFSNYKEILYHQGAIKPSGVWKEGVKI